MTDGGFRTDLRAWLADNPPPGRDGHTVEQQRRWQRTLHDAGWAGIAWPRELGGRGASPRQQLIFHEEHERAGGNELNLFFVALSHAGPTIIAHGTDEQRARFLPAILRGELIFCQCFSEPGAGSDLAAVRTKAVVDGDHLVITGEKRWSTHAQYADRTEMLVRTDGSSKHGGLTFVLADMHAPGVEVRPLPTMDGGAELNEVFFDEVRVPMTDVVGELGEGWRIATTTLLFERSTAFAGMVMATQREMAQLATSLDGDPLAEDRAGALAARALGMRALLYRAVDADEVAEPTPAGSAIKLLASELGFDLWQERALRDPDAMVGWLRSFGLRIGGGTSEIQRNIIGERVLALPREPRR